MRERSPASKWDELHREPDPPIWVKLLIALWFTLVVAVATWWWVETEDPAYRLQTCREQCQGAEAMLVQSNGDCGCLYYPFDHVGEK